MEPDWNEDVEIFRFHILDLMLAEVEQIGHQVTVRENHSFISELIIIQQKMIQIGRNIAEILKFSSKKYKCYGFTLTIQKHRCP